MIDDTGHTIYAPAPLGFSNPIEFAHALVHDSYALWKWTRAVGDSEFVEDTFEDLPFEPIP